MRMPAALFSGALSAIVLSLAASTAAAGVILVQDGRPTATIVIAASPSQNARAAANELQKYVGRMTGATLPITSDAASPAGTLILVGRSRLTDEIPDVKIPEGRTRNFREEGLVIRTAGDRLVLAGNDGELYLGTRYAVVEFLKQLGVRWFMPGEIGEVVPKMKTIDVPAMDISQRPDFPVRNFWHHHRGSMDAEDREWKIHNKMNPDSEKAFGVPSDGSVREYMPKDQFKAHPDWFALKPDGQRDENTPCMTSEGMITHFVERIKAEAKAGQKISRFAPDDGNPRCWCGRCAKIANGFDGFGANDRDPVPEACISNEWFYFVNRIMTEVNKEYPDHIIASNGYANRDIPPEMPPGVDFNPRHNLTVMFANINACTIHAYDDPKCWQMRRQGQMIRQWCKLSDKVWIYNYNYTMLVNKGTLTPMVHRIRRNIPLLKEWGLVGFHDQDETDWAMSGITTRYVRAALEWDTKTNVDALLDDFFTKWFGPAAEPMKAYYAALESAFENAPQHSHEDVILRAIYTEPLMARLAKFIEAADAAVNTDAQKLHMRIEHAMWDMMREFVALEKSKREGRFAETADHAARMEQFQADMNKITPFMGWHPYKAYECDWEKNRMRKTAALVDGTKGSLVALLPEQAAFRQDPFDDGRFEHWQEPTFDISGWKKLSTASGWDTQGYHDEQGHPYKGVGWYAWDVAIPADVKDKPVSLHGLAVVNEAWVWVNGHYAGHRRYMMPWFRPHELDLDVSKMLEPGRTNRIAVRVLCNFDVWGANGIYEPMFLYSATGAAAPPR